LDGIAPAATERLSMQSRRTFFGASALALSAAGVVAVAGSAAAAGSPYDLAAVEARLSLPFRHRQSFGSHALADGAATALMLNSLNAYQFDYGEGPGTLHALGIFYGTSVGILIDDAAWRKYKLDVVQQRRGDPARRRADNGGNPYAQPVSTLDPAAARSDLHGLYHDASIGALGKRGASFFACDNALRGLATDIAVAYGMSDEPVETVHGDLRAHLLTGVLLVPAGVAAVNQAQEMKFTFVAASV
jgi:intracellular sulfur oxidation DsrE/DsrF family protein